MFKLKTGTATQYSIEGETLLSVPFDIVQEVVGRRGKKSEVVVHSMAQSFPLSATAKEITAALNKHLAVYTEDNARHEATKEQQAALDASAATAQEISNLTL